MILRIMIIKIQNRPSFSTFDKIKQHDCIILKSFASATKSCGGSDDGDDKLMFEFYSIIFFKFLRHVLTFLTPSSAANSSVKI